MPSSHWHCASGAKPTVTLVSFIPAISFCDSEFSAVVTQPASASTTPSAASRASPNVVLNATPCPVTLHSPQPERRNKVVRWQLSILNCIDLRGKPAEMLCGKRPVQLRFSAPDLAAPQQQ